MNINLTLIGQLLSFVVFVWFTMKFIWTPIMGALEERRKGIADGLAVDEAKTNAHGEGERLLTAARAEIEQEINRAREQLRGKVAELAVIGAEKILHKEINATAHQEIVDSLAKEI
jgi:F-type H+-transporting ATPase subunit b